MVLNVQCIISDFVGFYEVDPGIVFLIDPFRLHACMALLARDGDGRGDGIRIDPPLTQGKHIKTSVSRTFKNNVLFWVKMFTISLCLLPGRDKLDGRHSGGCAALQFKNGGPHKIHN